MNERTMVEQQLLRLLQEPDGAYKLAQKLQPYVKDRVYEASFAAQIFDPETVDNRDSRIQVSMDRDELYIVVNVAQGGAGMSVNFRGDASAQMIWAPRMPAPFFQVRSNAYTVQDYRLNVYEHTGVPLTRMFEEEIPFILHKLVDRAFLIHAEAAIQAVQREANGGSDTALHVVAGPAVGPAVEASVFKSANARTDTNNDATPHPLTPADFGTMKNILVRGGKELLAKKILITEYDWNNMMSMTHEEVGPKLSDLVEKGITLKTLGGLEVVKTIKTGILREGNVYIFADQEYLGGMWELGDFRLYVDKYMDRTTFQGAWTVALAFANIKAIGKMELYSCDASLADADSHRSEVIPMDEDDLNTTNNEVADGGYYPSVEIY